MKILLVLPILIPLVTAACALVAWPWRGLHRGLGLVGSAGLLGAGIALLEEVRQNGILAVQLGDWPAPFGITLVADLFSSVMVLVAGFMGVMASIYSLGSIDPPRERFGYYPLFHILLMGVCGAFLTGDLFDLYVWFEVMLIASFVLLVLGGERTQMEGAIKYVTLNLVSSALFLTAVGILYGVVGTLNMADLAVKLRDVAQPGVLTALSMLFLVAFGIKAAAFPLFFWLPASYHTPPVVISAIFAGLLTKVGVYSLTRIFTLIFLQDINYTHTLILVLSGLTMVTGVLGAVAQSESRRLLSFHIVSQIGYLLMGLGLFTVQALTGMIFFIVHVILAKSALFLVSGVVHRITGTYELKHLGGLYHSYPGLSVLFLVPALSLGGIPPFSGFFAKLALIQAGLAIGQYAIIGAAVAVSILTLFSMLKIWAEAFWKPPSVSKPIESKNPDGGSLLLYLPIATLAILISILGVAAEPIFYLARVAAEQLMNPEVYISAILDVHRENGHELLNTHSLPQSSHPPKADAGGFFNGEY